MKTTLDILTAAQGARRAAATMDADIKHRALLAMAFALEQASGEILAANEKDVAQARGTVSDVMIDRLKLDFRRIKAMAEGIRQVAELPERVGEAYEETVRKDGLRIQKVAVPMGVVAIIYESRPNVTSDAAALCVKSSNVCVLRGGKEAFSTSFAIVTALRRGLVRVGLPEEMISLVEDTTRQSATDLMTAVGLVDLLIPRGGAGLIRAVTENAKVPTIQTGTGICHVFVDESANQNMALDVIENAKCSRPSVCNAMEVLLVHRAIAHSFLPRLEARLVGKRAEEDLPTVSFRLCPDAMRCMDGVAATEEDFDTEFLDYVMAVKVVDDVDGAIAHIAKHSTGHSEAILSRDEKSISRFTREVDSAAVYVNASTRFTDGGEFGLGCEMGISTQKLHARGPMGIAELCTYKYVVVGDGHTR